VKPVPRPAWYPDWSGWSAAVIACGPGATAVPLDLLRGRCKVLAVKEAHEIAPWADAVYGCDVAFWRNAQGLPKFSGLKVSYQAQFAGLRHVGIDTTQDRLLMTPGVIGNGGNSGFQAVNLALQWGARRIVLIGFDMTDARGVHFYGRASGDGRTNPGSWNFKRWRQAFRVAAGQLPALHARIVNATPRSELDAFPIMDLAEALASMEEDRHVSAA
jgi:hypothetical protein